MLGIFGASSFDVAIDAPMTAMLLTMKIAVASEIAIPTVFRPSQR
jgi:hypothetical protein